MGFIATDCSTYSIAIPTPRPDHRAGFFLCALPPSRCGLFIAWDFARERVIIVGAGECGSYERFGGGERMSGLNNSEAGDVIGIYRETVQELYRFVSRRSGGSRDLAEDITQETYLRAVRQWRSGRRPDVPLAWLQTVARNLLLNHYRRKTPEPIEAARIDALFEDGPPDGPDVAALVYWGLARLGRRRGELLEAYYLEGKKTATIAREFAISERAVEGRLRRARQALRTQLERLITQNGEIQ